MPSLQRTEHRNRRLLGIAAAVIVAPLLLSGCGLLGGSKGTTDPVQSSDPVASPKPTEKPVLRPEGTAEENQPFFVATLSDYAAGDAPIEGRPLVDALAKAGFEKKAMQLSFDRTKTNLVADNIFVSVRFGKDCLIGQVLTGSRKVYTEVAPAVGPDGKLCLIGETRPIDW
ncbi:MAG: hypothetical protein J0H64_01070 [Actinobacteria bacterium]|nr:hypothetical protein [Actinomycetota bacterium]